ncbi:MAG: GntR family transcriptional regulator [Syntrophales bacterium]
MRRSKDRIPDEVLEEIFPQKLSRFQSSEQVYAQLKKMILSGEFTGGKKLTQDEIAHTFKIAAPVSPIKRHQAREKSRPDTNADCGFRMRIAEAGI